MSERDVWVVVDDAMQQHREAIAFLQQAIREAIADLQQAIEARRACSTPPKLTLIKGGA